MIYFLRNGFLKLEVYTKPNVQYEKKITKYRIKTFNYHHPLGGALGSHLVGSVLF